MARLYFSLIASLLSTIYLGNCRVTALSEVVSKSKLGEIKLAYTRSYRLVEDFGWKFYFTF